MPGEAVSAARFETPATPEAVTIEPPVAVELIFDEHGSLPDAFLMERFGISSEEGRQRVTYGDYEGTIAQMLSGAPDPVTGKVCPVGEVVRAKHTEKGVAGTREAFDGMRMMGGKFDERTFVIRDKAPEDYERAAQERSPANPVIEGFAQDTESLKKNRP